MGFLQGIFPLHYSVHLTDEGYSESGRLKIAVHPEESFDFLVSRIIAFAHCRPLKAVFSAGLSDVKQPALWAFDEIEQLTAWIDIGDPDEKRIKAARNADRGVEVRHYFFEEEQIRKYCSFMRGSRENWVARIRYFLIDPELLSAFAEDAPTTVRDSNWELVFSDGSLFIEKDGASLYGGLTEIDMWQLFQKSIQNQ